MYSCTLLNMTGDVTISWDQNNHEEIKKWIDSKLKEGCTFFILEKKLGIIPIKTKVKDAKQLKKTGNVVISDDEMASSFLKKDIISKQLTPKKSKVNFNQPTKTQFKLGDKGAEKLIEQEYAFISKKENEEKHKVLKTSSNPNEIIKNNTICTRRAIGG